MKSLGILLMMVMALAGCGHKTNIAPLVAQQNAQADQINAMASQLATMQAQLKIAQLGATDNTVITALQGTITDLQKSVTDLQTLQSSTSTSTSTSTSQIQTTITADEATIAALATQVQTLAAQVAPLLARIDATVNQFFNGDLVNGGALTVTVMDVIGTRAGANVTVFSTGAGVTINGQPSPATITTGSNGQAAFTLVIPADVVGQLWTTTPTSTGVATSQLQTIGHLVSPISIGFAPAAGVTWDIQSESGTAKITAHFPVGTTGTVSFSSTNNGVLAPANNIPISNGTATTVLTGTGVYIITVSLDAAPVLAKSLAARALSGVHMLAGGTTLSGSVTVSTAAAAWTAPLSVAVNIVATPSAVYATAGQHTLQKSDTSGNFVWSITVGGALEANQQGAFDTDGTNVFVGSNVGGVPGVPGNLRKIDPSGTTLWTTALAAQPMVVTSFGTGVLVADFRSNGTLTAYNATGGAIWTVSNIGVYIAGISVSGDIYVVGTSAPGATDVKAARLNSSTGATVWNTTIQTNGQAYSVSATTEGAYVSGRGYTSNTGVFQKLSLSDGSVIWDKTASGASGIFANQLFATQNGLFANTSEGIQKYDYTGALIWTSATTQSGWGLYILGQEAFYATSANTIGRVNDVY